jgi:DNA-binding transcriptional LysR family regulator
MPDWNDLKYCLHVAREGSTLAAARVLDISQTTVMRRIAALEEQLGYELFEKRRNGYSPTQTLRDLLPQLEAVEQAHAAFDHASAHAGRTLKGTVRLTAAELLVSHFVSTALAEFGREYPDIKIELFTTDALLDLTKGEADIALRAGDPPTEATLFGRRIVADDRWSICCSRVYAAKHGIPRNIDELQQHMLVSVIEGQFQSAIVDWVRENVREENIAIRHNSLMAIYMSVKAGLGVSPCPDMLSAVDPDLIRCMPLELGANKEVWILAPERLRRTRHVRIVLDFLANHIISALKQAERSEP